jgi:hypothetical protein
MHGRPPAALTIRDAAEAMALSWFKTERRYVSSMHASAKEASTIRMGELGK